MTDYYRIMAIDYGRKRIGIAVTDLMRIIVQAKEHILNTNADDVLNKINSFVISENIEKIILGCPEENKQNESLVKEINNFSLKLLELCKKEIVIVDESYSSVKAMDKMIESGKKKKYRSQKGNIDSFAAAIILEEYLQNENY